MKIRIFALARELGLDSKVLLGLCDEAGVPLRNALATITPEQRDQIVAYVKKDGGGGPATAATPAAEDLTPKRESNTGKLRDIRVLAQTGSKPESTRVDDAGTETAEPVADEVEVEVDSAPPMVEAEVEVAPAELESPADVVAEQPAEAKTEAPAATVEVDDAAPVAEAKVQPEDTVEVVEPIVEATPPAAAVPAAKSELTPQKRPPSLMQKMGGRREMKPIGSVKDRDASTAGSAPEKPKDTPRERPTGRPLVAAIPQYQPPAIKPKPKKPAEKAMKPDISLDKIVDRNSPLANQLADLKKAKAEYDGAAQQTGPGKRKNARKGSLLVELRKSREEQRQQKKLRRKKGNRPAADLKSSAEIQFPINVRSLSEAIGRPAKSIMGYFFKEGKMITINDELSQEDALEVAMELGVDLHIKERHDVEAELLASLDQEEDEDDL